MNAGVKVLDKYVGKMIVIMHSVSYVACHWYLAHCVGACGVINPRRACAARVTVVVSVCLSVDDYSRTTGYEAAYERYQQLQCYKGKKNNVAIFGDQYA